MITLTAEQAQQIVAALDLAQALLEKSYHHDTILRSYKAIRAARAQEQAEQEPVAYMFKVKRTLPSSTPLDVFAAIEYHPLPHEDIISKEPLYIAPVQQVDLTDDEILQCGGMDGADDWAFKFARAVIAAFKEKNK